MAASVLEAYDRRVEPNDRQPQIEADVTRLGHDSISHRQESDGDCLRRADPMTVGSTDSDFSISHSEART